MSIDQERSWIQTYTGKKFYPLNPRSEDINLIDIAHALSMQCRFTGHTKRFYCPHPEHRVLTDDMTWTPSGELEAGQGLIAFDEHPIEKGQAGNLRRRFRHGHVVQKVMVKREMISLQLEDGTILKASEEHPWLTTVKSGGNLKWMTCLEIMKDLSMKSGKSQASHLEKMRQRWMQKFMPVWSEPNDYRSGWLAGIIDGEGYLSILNRDGVQMGISQNPGEVLNRIIYELDTLGFEYGISTTGESSTVNLQIKGGWREISRLIGTTKPVRLLSSLKKFIRSGQFCKQMNGDGDLLRIVEAKKIGMDWVAGIETSGHTYLCEGFGAHNSVGEHCYRAAIIHAAVYPNCIHETLWMLLHDAAEAYLIDLAKPVKINMPFYCEAEEKLMAAVCKRFDLHPVMPESVKKIDQLMLAMEARDLMGPLLLGWEAWDTGILTEPKLKSIYDMYRITEYIEHYKNLTDQKIVENYFLDQFCRITHRIYLESEKVGQTVQTEQEN